MTGIYAVVAYTVSQQAREIGIRIALGATRSSILRLVVGHGIGFVLAGLAAGTAIAIGATRLLSTLLFGLAATDAATFGEVIAFVAAVSMFASAMPLAAVDWMASGVLKGE